VSHSMQCQTSAMYRVVCIYKTEHSSVSGQAVTPWSESPHREQERFPWLEDKSEQAPLTLKMMQIGILALLMRWPFFQLMMVG